MTVSRDELLGLVQDFVRERQGGDLVITPTTRLLAEGYLDSFAIVELTARLDDRLSLHLDPGALLPEDYDTIETMWGRLGEV